MQRQACQRFRRNVCFHLLERLMAEDCHLWKNGKRGYFKIFRWVWRR